MKNTDLLKSIDLPEGWLQKHIDESRRFWESLGPVAQKFLEPLRHINDGIKQDDDKRGPQ